MIITNCNDSERLDCLCTVSFDVYSNNTVSVLSVGNLIGTPCIFDAYVIDWYLDGQHVFISGVGDDPDIEVYHPFTGSAAIPVPGGTYLPVVRYVVIDGVMMFPVPKPCQKWCSTLQLIDVLINVLPVNCGTVSSPIPTPYNFRISYISTQDFSLATRTIRFDLPTDLSATRLAVAFNGAVVADKIDIYFLTEDNLLSSYIIGSRYNTWEFETMPYRIAISGAYKYIVNLPEYEEGDFLIIKITPSVLETNTNTNWTLDLKCLTNETYETYLFDDIYRIIDPESVYVEVTETGSTCNIDCKFNMLNPIGAVANTNLAKYAGMSQASINSGVYNVITGAAYLRKSIMETSTSIYYPNTSGTHIASEGIFSFTKTGNVLVYGFTTDTDYNLYKTRYNNLMASSFGTGYDPDNTQLNHYRYIRIIEQLTTTQCGDNYISFSFWVHYNTLFEFDDVNRTITITQSNMTNNFLSSDCSTVYATVQNYVNINNNFATYMNISANSVCMISAPFMGISFGVNPYNTNPVNAGAALMFWGTKFIEGFDFTEFCTGVSTYFYLFYLRFTVLDFDDPVNNFRLENLYNSTTKCLSNSSTGLIYEKIGGVQTFPIP